jgi:hypothetical protein
MNQFLKHSIWGIWASIIIASCSDNELNTTTNTDFLFPNTFEIRVDTFSYTDPSDLTIYKINPDSVTDTLGPMPEFKWRNDDAPNLVCIAISSDSLLVENGQIENPEKIIWEWHSGMKEEIIGNEDNKSMRIPFIEGRSVDNKNILYDTQPSALENGLYYWAIWGWDADGKTVIYSSRQRRFAVK